MQSEWHPTLRHFREFFLQEMGLLNPVFFVGMLWAMVAFWKHRQQNPLGLYFFCLGGLVFLGHLVYSLHSRILPNWIAPAVLPMYCLMVVYWDARWREGVRAVKGWLIGGLILGLTIVALMHDTGLIGKIAGHPLPGDVDPLRRVRGYQAAAACVEQAREKLLPEGKPAFIICGHYGITGLFTFYLPEAQDRAAHPTARLLHCFRQPDNQFYFWPEYRYCRPSQRRKRHLRHRARHGPLGKRLVLEMADRQGSAGGQGTESGRPATCFCNSLSRSPISACRKSRWTAAS
jgi:4-amino-4-deoxy-L-arabinose transferase-like glycosyltransferase